MARRVAHRHGSGGNALRELFLVALKRMLLSALRAYAGYYLAREVAAWLLRRFHDWRQRRRGGLDRTSEGAAPPTTPWAVPVGSGREQTLLAHAGCEVDPTTGALTPPIHLASTFERDADLGYSRGFVYGRAGNPTRALLERTAAELEGGSAACAFASGSAAANAVFQALPGGHVVLPTDVYHGNRELLRSVFDDWGLKVTVCDMTDLADVRAAVAVAFAQQEQAGAAVASVLVWTETPSNPRLLVTDIAAVSAIASEAGACHLVDATWLTPCLCKPLALGADLVLHSSTKYMGGHSDLVGGLVVCGSGSRSGIGSGSGSGSGSGASSGASERGDSAGRALFERVAAVQRTAGAVAAPFDCWLLLRGLRSLWPRMRLHCHNAAALADFLEAQDAVERVFYPGLASHPGHAVASEQMTDGCFGGMLSFLVIGGEDAAVRVVAACRLARRATSLGGTETLVEHRASVEPVDSPTPTNLVRVSVGLEGADDIIEDFRQALQAA